MNSLYIKERLALIDFSKHYIDSYEELLNSEEFKYFLSCFFKDMYTTNKSLYDWVLAHSKDEDIISHHIKALKYVSMIEVDRNIDLSLHGKILLDIVEQAYHYWRNLSRFSIVYTTNDSGLLTSNFMNADHHFNELILSFYRNIQEKLQGYRNSVYRNLQAGTCASILLCKHRLNLGEEYEQIAKVPFIQKLMLRSPLIMNLKHNKRYGTFTETSVHPLSEKNSYRDFMVFPIMVGKCLTYVYFHKDFMASAIGLANLFEFVPIDETNKKPDCMILFGVEDGKEDTTYYYDEKNDIYIGKISYMPIIEYFGYFKKMALTLHNLVMIKKGYLPIHGAMLNIYLKDGRRKGVCLMGDSGAGKSETIEALNHLSSSIEHQELVFDDMGVMYINKDGQVVCEGTETGAFVRLDDLDSASAYKDLDRSIFFNPGQPNARVITPASSYDLITHQHKVDVFLYANNYDDAKGIRVIENPDEAKQIYIEGKRFALGTTNEKGLSTTFFANPFGPMQEKEKTSLIIDEVFESLSENKVVLGEIYTNLGLKDKGNGGIDLAAKELLNMIEK